MRYAVLLALLLLPGVASAALVNINTADAALLDTLPGIGPTKAAAIIAYRGEHGPFAAIEDIQNVSGIGPATFANLKAQITVAGGESSVQPKAPANGYTSVQEVEQITSTTDTPHDEVVAPAAAAEGAAAGAPLPPRESRGEDLFSSPWIWGLLGVIILAGGAFILL